MTEVTLNKHVNHPLKACGDFGREVLPSRETMVNETNPPCPRCKSSNVIRNGRPRRPKLGPHQQYMCKDCPGTHRWNVQEDPQYEQQTMVRRLKDGMIKAIAICALPSSFEEAGRFTHVKAERIVTTLKEAYGFGSWEELERRVFNREPAVITGEQMNALHDNIRDSSKEGCKRLLYDAGFSAHSRIKDDPAARKNHSEQIREILSSKPIKTRAQVVA